MNKTLFTLFETITDLVNKLIYIVISLALVVFMWGIVKYLFNASKPEARKEARSYMIYGIITLFVMTSVWSIVYLFKDFVEPTSTSQSFNIQNSINSTASTFSRATPFRNVDQLFEHSDQFVI